MSYDDPYEERDEPSIDVTCVRVRETEKAILVIEPESGEEIWLPLSQIKAMHFDKKGNGYVEITEWIAKKKGLMT
jgi:hypothetical protein